MVEIPSHVRLRIESFDKQILVYQKMIDNSPSLKSRFVFFQPKNKLERLSEQIRSEFGLPAKYEHAREELKKPHK